ncbi:hypothetical protein HYZ78_00650 [Candidatus Microgenomates bacterium]|nr:hypothetical protein [Candidatus Microgenomates bacterium]
MAKKRKTKAQKIKAINKFEPVTFNYVNREFTHSEAGKASQDQLSKKTVNSVQTVVLASTKKDLVRTFILASIILSLEAVLYFFWK